MILFTLDTNCIIDLEQNNAFAGPTLALVAAHKEGLTEVAIPAVAASERQPSGGYLERFDEFKERLARAGLQDLKVIHPIAYWGISFYGMGYWPDESMIELEKCIQLVLHPDVEFALADFYQARGLEVNTRALPRQWRNAKCDVQALWSHIYHRRTCFVTRDENFLKASKLPRLLELGAGSIMRPAAAAVLVGQSASPPLPD